MSFHRSLGLSAAGRVAVAYMVVGAVWIVSTDRAVLDVFLDPALITAAQTVKGVVFVAGSAAVLYALVDREQRRLTRTNDRLEDSLQHATVLHRLLRHDLRNSADVIVNNIGLLRADTEDREECYDRIERRAASLAGIAEKCRHLRTVLFEGTRVAVDVAAVTRDEVATFRERFPNASVTVDAPERAMASAHPRLGTAIGELLANAATHDEEDVSVSVSVDASPETVTVAMTDDGPGLPEGAAIALRGEREEPLAHAQGIGLWLVRFLVSRSAGSVSATREDPGTTVTVTLPTT